MRSHPNRKTPRKGRRVTEAGRNLCPWGAGTCGGGVGGLYHLPGVYADRFKCRLCVRPHHILSLTARRKQRTPKRRDKPPKPTTTPIVETGSVTIHYHPTDGTNQRRLVERALQDSEPRSKLNIDTQWSRLDAHMDLRVQP